MSTDYTSISDHFWRLVDKSGECWEWRAQRNDKGYGMFRGEFAHRVSYLITHAEIPSGLLIRHTCDNPGCVRPDHLIPGTPMDNKQDCIERNRMPYGDNHYSRLKPELIRHGADAPGAKLSDAQIVEIRTFCTDNPKASKSELARIYGVSRITIWRHTRDLTSGT